MSNLIVGADNQNLRLIIAGDAWIEEVIELEAKQRNERIIIDQFVNKNGLEWKDFDRLVLFNIPTSKTSVRVAKTILLTSGWLYKTPVLELDVENFLNLSRSEIEGLVADLGS